METTNPRPDAPTAPPTPDPAAAPRGRTATIVVSRSIAIPRSPDEVWAFVADYDNDRRWRHGLVEMTPSVPGPARVGTTVHEVVRKLGSTYVTDSTVTEAGPRSYRFAGHGDSGRVEGGRSVVVDEAGRARFTYDIELEVSGFNALLAPVVRWVLGRGLGRDLAALGRVLSDR